MRPVNRMSPAKALEYRKRLSGLAVNKAKGKPANGYPEERLIEEKYRHPYPHIHIFEVPCYLPLKNEYKEMARPIFSKKLKRYITRHYLLDKWHAQARNNVLAALARHVPFMNVDQDAESRRVGRAKKMREAIEILVLSRISPGLGDDDGHVFAVAGVRDTVCAWIENGPVFDVNRIGDFDDIIRSPNRPNGRIDVIDKDQIVRTGPKGREVRAAIPPYAGIRKAMKENGEKCRRLAGSFGVQIELHLKEDFSI